MKMRPTPWNVRSFLHGQKGQSYAELVVCMAVIGLSLLGAYHLWRYGELSQMTINAARFAAYERTVWEPEDSDIEKHAVHKSNASLSHQTLITQFSLPQAFHQYRQGSSAQTYTTTSTLLPSIKTFANNNPADFLDVHTDSTTNPYDRWGGRDPTGNTVTKLKLDDKVLRTTTVTISKDLLTELTQYTSAWMKNHNHLGFGKLSFSLPHRKASTSLTLISNAWEASNPVNRIRSGRQLNPLSSGDSIAGERANVLASFTGSSGGAEFEIGDLMGLTPLWNLVGGPYGLGGQYVVKQIGASASQINGLAGSGNWSWNPNDNLASNLMVQAQWDAREYLQMFAIPSLIPTQHLGVRDDTNSDSAKPNRDSVLGRDKRKFRSYQLKNPVDLYFADGSR